MSRAVAMVAVVVGVLFASVPAGAQADPISISLETSCFEVGGRIDATIRSDFAAGSTPEAFIISLIPSEIPARGIFLAPGAVHVETFTSRPDGVHEVAVTAGGWSDSASVAIDCVGLVEELGGGDGSSVLCVFAPTACSAAGVIAGVGDAVDAVADATAGAVLDSLQSATAEAVAWVLRSTVGWWVGIPSVVSSNTAVVANIQGQFLWVSGAMTVLGIIVQGIRMIVTRRAEAGADVFAGLFTIGFVSSGGWLLVTLASQAFDQWAASILTAAVSNPAVIDQVAVSLMALPPWATTVLGLAMLLTGLAQAALALMRDAAVILMAALLPFAGSARLFGWGRPWLPRLVNALVALMLWKVIAAASIAAAIYLMGAGNGLPEVMAGAGLLVASVVSLPMLMRLFAFADVGGSIVGSASRGAGLAGGAMAAAHLSSMGRSSASTQAASVAATRTQTASATASGAGAAGAVGGGAASAVSAAGPVLAGTAVVVQGARKVTDKAAAQLETGGQQ